MEMSLIRPGELLPDIRERLLNHEPVRITQELDNGNIAIIQIANPNAVSKLVKWLRYRTSFLGRRVAAIEAAFRVGFIVYGNYIRKGDKVKPTVVKPQRCQNRKKENSHG